MNIEKYITSLIKYCLYFAFFANYGFYFIFEQFHLLHTIDLQFMLKNEFN